MCIFPILAPVNLIGMLVRWRLLPSRFHLKQSSPSVYFHQTPKVYLCICICVLVYLCMLLRWRVAIKISSQTVHHPILPLVSFCVICINYWDILKK